MEKGREPKQDKGLTGEKAGGGGRRQGHCVLCAEQLGPCNRRRNTLKQQWQRKTSVYRHDYYDIRDYDVFEK